MDAPKRGHGREVDTEGELQDDEGNEGDLSDEGTVSGAVSRECRTKVSAKQ